MELNQIKEEFINATKDGSKVTYSRKIRVFTDFLIERCSVNRYNSKETLRGIGTDKILESIEYYVENYGIQFKCTIDNYVTVIKNYFVFIAKEYDIHNDIFDSNAKLAKLDDLINGKIEQLGLEKTKMKDPITDEEFQLLLDCCNECIDKFELEDYSNETSYNGDASSFISAIIMKLVMYTGIKNSVIPTIKRRDYNCELNQIKVNGLWISLPDRLALDFRKYFDLRKHIISQKSIDDKKENPFFINSKGDYMSKASSDELYKIMNQQLGTREGEALCKNVIMKHIEAGINIIEIMNLTTFSINTCRHCKELLNEKLDKQRNKYINTKLRGSLIYEILQ